MVTLLREGNTPNINTQEFLLNSEEELSTIPNSAPAGSIAIILGSTGLVKKMKSNQGKWITI